MPQTIEHLEPRQLFTVTAATLTADLAKINTDIVTIKAALNQVRKSAATTYNIVAAGVKAVETPKNRAAYQKLLTAIQRAGGLGSPKILAAVNSFCTTAKSHATRTAADGKALLAKPTQAALKRRVTADTTALFHNAVVKFSAAESVVSSLYQAENNAYTSAINTVASVKTPYLNQTVLNNPVNEAFGNAVEQIAIDCAQLSSDLGGPGISG